MAPRSKAGSEMSSHRRVFKQCHVDETLFGTKSKQAIVTKEQHEHSHTKAGKVTPDMVVVSKKDITRMLDKPPILSSAEVEAMRKEAEETREHQRATANARKARMLELEEAKKQQMPPTETEQLKQKADAALLSRAEQIALEQQDEAKAMNQMVQYSKCVAIRDAQLLERKQMMLEEEEESRRLDIMMEIERLKALENYEERERQRKAERVIGAKILQSQLDERQRVQVLRQELQEQERQVIQSEAARLQEQELRMQVEKKLRAQALVSEVLAANEEQIARKRDLQKQEQEEDARIIEYNHQKQLREQAIAEEKERIAAEKERECARLRAAQERAADRRSELDELRARRHAEAAEREWRAKEAARAERNKAILEDLQVSRQQQRAARLVQQAELATREKAEFDRILKANQEKEAEETSMNKKVAALRKQHQQELKAQIAAAEEQRHAARAAHLEEGRSARKAAADHVAKVEAIKQRKLRELEEAGVPAKYCAELAKYKVGQSND